MLRTLDGFIRRDDAIGTGLKGTRAVCSQGEFLKTRLFSKWKEGYMLLFAFLQGMESPPPEIITALSCSRSWALGVFHISTTGGNHCKSKPFAL